MWCDGWSIKLSKTESTRFKSYVKFSHNFCQIRQIRWKEFWITPPLSFAVLKWTKIIKLVKRQKWPVWFYIGCIYFCSARCICNKVVCIYNHFYYLPTSWGPFAHLGDTPLRQTMSASWKCSSQVMLCPAEMNAPITYG